MGSWLHATFKMNWEHDQEVCVEGVWLNLKSGFGIWGSFAIGGSSLRLGVCSGESETLGFGGFFRGQDGSWFAQSVAINKTKQLRTMGSRVEGVVEVVNLAVGVCDWQLIAIELLHQ